MLPGSPAGMPQNASILVACGIARPEPMVQHLLQKYPNVHLLAFPDHYYYTQKDLDKMKLELEQMDGAHKIIVTTEKDAVRLHLLQERIEAMQLPFMVLPVEVSFLFEAAGSFNSHIFDYVAKAIEAGSEP